MAKGIRKGKSREIIRTDFNLPAMYKFYLSELISSEEKSSYNVSSSLYGSICKDFNKGIADVVLNKPFGITLPCVRGRLYIRKRNGRPFLQKDGKILKGHIPVNWNETIKLWESDPVAKSEKRLIRHINPNTDGKVYEFKWDKKPSNVKNKLVYYWRPTRTIKVKLAKMLGDENRTIDYYEKV